MKGNLLGFLLGWTQKWINQLRGDGMEKFSKNWLGWFIALVVLGFVVDQVIAFLRFRPDKRAKEAVRSFRSVWNGQDEANGQQTEKLNEFGYVSYEQPNEKPETASEQTSSEQTAGEQTSSGKISSEKTVSEKASTDAKTADDMQAEAMERFPQKKIEKQPLPADQKKDDAVSSKKDRAASESVKAETDDVQAVNRTENDAPFDVYRRPDKASRAKRTEAVKPQSEQANAAKPVLGQPDTAETQFEQTDAVKPKADPLEAIKSFFGQLRTRRPQTEQAEASEPQSEQSGILKSFFGQLRAFKPQSEQANVSVMQSVQTNASKPQTEQMNASAMQSKQTNASKLQTEQMNTSAMRSERMNTSKPLPAQPNASKPQPEQANASKPQFGPLHIPRLLWGQSNADGAERKQETSLYLKPQYPSDTLQGSSHGDPSRLRMSVNSLEKETDASEREVPLFLRRSDADAQNAKSDFKPEQNRKPVQAFELENMPDLAQAEYDEEPVTQRRGR